MLVLGAHVGTCPIFEIPLYQLYNFSHDPNPVLFLKVKMKYYVLFLKVKTTSQPYPKSRIISQSQNEITHLIPQSQDQATVP